jgi:tripartite-type tricarboxylate transporter receptor subunit TctC
LAEVPSREETLAPARALLAALVLVAAAPAAADSVGDFYRGKQITMGIPSSPGGDYDLRARLLSRHMGKHIPGNPTLVPKNMPAGVGLEAMNWLFNIAPRDGTAIEIAIATMVSNQAMGGQGVQFDAAKFIWLGNTTDSPDVVTSWYTTGIKTVEDAKQKQLVVGAPGTATPSAYYPLMMNALLGTKFKIITGYPGGNDVNFAMERGEVGGRGSNSWASWKATKPDWLKEGKIIQLVQIGLKKAADLPDVPLLMDLGKNAHDRAMLRFISAGTAFSRAFVTTPDVPADRVAALRKAFDDTMTDPDFRAETDKINMDIAPSTGPEVQKIVDGLIATPKDVVMATKAILDKVGEQEKLKK